MGRVVKKHNGRRFFDLLKHDSMLRTENITVTTRITILNYDDYQRNSSAQRKRKRNATQTAQTHSDPNNNIIIIMRKKGIYRVSEKNQKEKEFDRFNDWVDKNIPLLAKK